MFGPPNRGSINSTQIHGTRVPVEEPSTASENKRTPSAAQWESTGLRLSPTPTDSPEAALLHYAILAAHRAAYRRAPRQT